MLYGKKGEQIKPVKKKTTQGQGRNSKPSHGRKLKRGQG
jgi:hypothetical protein